MKMKMQKSLLNVLMVEANRQMQKLNRKAVRAAPEFRVDYYNWMADPELGLLSTDAERTTLYLIRFDKHGASAEADVTTVIGAESGSTASSTTELAKHTALSKCVKAIWEHAQRPLVGNKALTGDDADALVSVGASSLPTGRSAPTGRKRVVDSMCEELNAALAALGTAHTKDFRFQVSSAEYMVAELYGKQYTVRRSRTVCVSDIGDTESVQVLNTGGHPLPTLSHIARKILEHVESTRLAHESAPSAPATTATTPATYPRALVVLGVALNAELYRLALRCHQPKITFNLESFPADPPTGKYLTAYANRQYYFVYGNKEVRLSRIAFPHPEDSQLPTGGTSPKQIANAIWAHVRKQCKLWTGDYRNYQENTMHKSNKVVTTTMLSRFQDALTLLCGERPSESLCREWMQDFNDELQGWVLHRISPITPWATGIGIIDAAWAMASEPEEGEDYDHQS